MKSVNFEKLLEKRPNQEFLNLEFAKLFKVVRIRCDCGAEKTYGSNTNLHASYCSKVTK